jgi:16S rRNA G1207 methylase RsmC
LQHLPKTEGPAEIIDLGCGNGLQGILLKMVAPHKKTRQIELSKKYLETGNIFVEALGLDKPGFSFENNDIGAVDVSDADFIYMYRPARPMGEGKLFYENLAEKFSRIKKNFYLLSVADCFEPFIKSKYIKIYSNDFLSIFYFEN